MYPNLRPLQPCAPLPEYDETNTKKGQSVMHYVYVVMLGATPIAAYGNLKEANEVAAAEEEKARKAHDEKYGRMSYAAQMYADVKGPPGAEVVRVQCHGVLQETEIKP